MLARIVTTQCSREQNSENINTYVKSINGEICVSTQLIVVDASVAETLLMLMYSTNNDQLNTPPGLWDQVPHVLSPMHYLS